MSLLNRSSSITTSSAGRQPAAPLVVMATFVFVIGVVGVVTLTKNVVLQFASVLMCKIVIELDSFTYGT